MGSTLLKRGTLPEVLLYDEWTEENPLRKEKEPLIKEEEIQFSSVAREELDPGKSSTQKVGKELKKKEEPE